MLQPESANSDEARAAISAAAPRTVAICAFGGLIREPLLSTHEIVNVHPSLLPRWRGAAPVERAIMAGDRETGVTIHQTIAELDAGPISYQEAFAIEPEHDAGEVYGHAGVLAAMLVDATLRNRPVLRPQPEEGVTYAERLTPADRQLDWSRPPAESLNRIRALSPHIGARGEVDGRPLIVWRARLGEGDLNAGGLELLEVQPEGRKRMSAAEYLRGLRS